SAVDRASDVDDNCEELVNLLHHRHRYIINDPKQIKHASDKASMHLEFITAGIFVPYTIIISPYNRQREVKLSLSELARLGRPFIIKPANTTGGGIGVVTGAESLQDVIETRQHNRDDKYLLQEKIEPMIINGRRAWFRSFYACGKVFEVWWDDLTHVYERVTDSDYREYKLHEVSALTEKIHNVCGLDFFSTEVALTSNGKFIVIDYVNEMPDMRLKSLNYDGVPDNVVVDICRELAKGISRAVHSK
ncbi:MAG: hypothetical protein ACPL1K_07765, partial [Candidatus Kryptoniota bacterium]